MSYKHRLVAFLFIDTFIVFSAVLISYILRFDGAVPIAFHLSIPYTFVLVFSTCYGMFLNIKLYKRVWQYASVGELIAIIRATSLAVAGSYAIYQLLYHVIGVPYIIPRSVFLISWMTIVLGIGGSRFLWRIFRDKYIKLQPHHRRVMIVGAGRAGANVVRELKHSPDTLNYPVVFVDDAANKQDLEILGLPVAGDIEDIPQLVISYKVDVIIVAIPSATKAQLTRIIEVCKATKAHIKLLPAVNDVLRGKVSSIKLIRDVRMEDLLGRDEVTLDNSSISEYIQGQTILVTGAGGSIGSELCRQISMFNPTRLLLFDHAENFIYEIDMELRRAHPNIEIVPVIADVRDTYSLDQVFGKYHPNVVFHAAAYKHVPLMEYNMIEAVKNNVIGTRNVAAWAHKYGATHFVLVSTDKAVNPSSIMGATKRIAEMIVQCYAHTSHTKFSAVRFGNVLGSRGSVIPLFQKQIEEGGPVTVTHPEMVRYFMTITEAVQLIIQAGALARGGEIFILSMGQPVRIMDLAQDLIRLSGYEPNKEIEIRISGIRPGEKLKEELFSMLEYMDQTRHESIYVEKPTPFAHDEFLHAMQRLDNLLQEADMSPRAIKMFIQQIVPSYKAALMDEMEDLEMASQEAAAYKSD